MTTQKGKYYLYSADLKNKGKYAIGVLRGKMQETKLKDRPDQIETKHKALNDKAESISAEPKKNKS
jgi:hypothetical protein